MDCDEILNKVWNNLNAFFLSVLSLHQTAKRGINDSDQLFFPAFLF